MTNSVGDAAAKRKPSERPASVTREVSELVRHCSSIDGRHGFRVTAGGVSGHIFFERGRVIHAEFGEDCGLRAVVEMLRAGPAQLEAASIWPSQPSLHLGPELLLSLTGGDASRVVRKVDLPVEPPPLPDPRPTELEALVSPGHPAAVRVPGKRAISGVMARVFEHEDRDAAEMASVEIAPPSSAAPDASGAAASASASRRSAAVAASRLAAAVAASERSLARTAGQHSPPPPPVRPRPAVDSSAPAAPALGPEAPRELPISRAQTARSRSIVVARAPNPAGSSNPTAASNPGGATNAGARARPATTTNTATPAAAPKAPSPKNDAPGNVAPSRAPSRAPAAAPSEQQPTTTMVRIASRGDLLAARGKNAEQLAEAAAFIHGLANLIAADFGRHGRANVHLSGGGLSLLVARSEVNDIAAALGPTERLTSLLNKVGFK
jgi:hypothetical protein